MSVKKGNMYKGKRGKTVTYELNGQEVQRTIGVRTTPPTISDLARREKMTIVNNLHQPVKEFLRTGYKIQGKRKRKTAYAMAVSYNITQAIAGTYPEFEIDFDKVLFSQGDLPVSEDVQVEVRETGLAFTWNPGLLKKGMKSNDSVLMLAYCAEKESAFFEVNGNRRSFGNDFLEVTAYHQQMTLEVYVAFESAEGKSISNSFHVGQVRF